MRIRELLAWFLAVSAALGAAPRSERPPPDAREPRPTRSALETVAPTASPLPPVVSIPPVKMVHVRISDYWPPDGGDSCAHFVNGNCLSQVGARGERESWRNWIDRGAACPPEFPFGTTIVIDGRLWTCIDRGGRIRYQSGVPWVDLLTEHPIATYGSIVPAEIQFPMEGFLCSCDQEALLSR